MHTLQLCVELSFGVLNLFNLINHINSKLHYIKTSFVLRSLNNLILFILTKLNNTDRT